MQLHKFFSPLYEVLGSLKRKEGPEPAPPALPHESTPVYVQLNNVFSLFMKFWGPESQPFLDPPLSEAHVVSYLTMASQAQFAMLAVKSRPHEASSGFLATPT